MRDTFVGSERRRVMRVDVPRHLRGRELEPHFVHLLNLSPLGARVTHLEPWHEGVACAVWSVARASARAFFCAGVRLVNSMPLS